MNKRGFTLTEVLIAMAILAMVTAGIGGSFVAFQGLAAPAGQVSISTASGALYVPFAPSTSAWIRARALVQRAIELSDEASYIMAVEGVLAASVTAGEEIYSVRVGPSDAVRSPSSLRAQLVAPVDANGVPLSGADVSVDGDLATRGYTVLYFGTGGTLRGVLRVSGEDTDSDGGTVLLWTVSLETTASSEVMAYQFVEPILGTSAATRPSFRFESSAGGKPYLRLTLPSPVRSIRTLEMRTRGLPALDAQMAVNAERSRQLSFDVPVFK